MVPYYTAMVLSVVCTFCVSRVCVRRIAVALLSLFAVAVPCVLAAFRDVGIGTDMLYYSEALYRSALMSSDSLVFIAGGSAEPLFSLVALAGAKVFSSKETFYFMVELLIVAPMYLALKRLVPLRWLPYAWLLFWLVMFAYGFNLMRQCIAVSLTFYAFSFLTEKRRFHFILFSTLSLGFHLTAVIGIAVALFYCWLEGSNFSLLKVTALLMATLLLLYVSPSLIQALSGLRQSYAYQAAHIADYSLGNMAWRAFASAVFFVPALLMVFTNFEELAEGDSSFSFKVAMVFMAVLTSSLVVVSPQMYRVALYFWNCFPWIISSLLCKLGDPRDTTVYAVAQVILLLVSFNRYVTMGNGEIYPYTSTVLGIAP